MIFAIKDNQRALRTLQGVIPEFLALTQPMALVVANVPEEQEAMVTSVGPKELARRDLVSLACNVLILTRGRGADLVQVVTKEMECAVSEELVANSGPVNLVSRHTLYASTDKRKLIHDWLIRSSTIRLLAG